MEKKRAIEMGENEIKKGNSNEHINANVTIDSRTCLPIYCYEMILYWYFIIGI